MNKQEFLSELSQKLSGMPSAEVADVIQYYSEYFDEAGEENTQQTIHELGSASDIAKRLLAQSRATNGSEKAQDTSGGWAQSAYTNGQKLSAFQKIDASTVAESISIKYGDVYSIEIEGDTRVIAYNLEGETLRVWRIKNFFGISFRITRVTITIPARTRLERCRASSVSGNLNVRIDANDMAAKTTSGAIEVRGNCDTAKISSVSGTVSFFGAAEDFGAKTTSGAITAEGKIGNIRASSVSGKIRMKLEHGEQDYTMNLSSVSGVLSAGNNRFSRRAQIGAGSRRLDAKTTSGAILIEFNKGGSAQ